MEIWQGMGKNMDEPASFIAENSFTFGGKLIPQGSAVKQWETANFGWTSWIDPDEKMHLAKE